MKGNGDMLVAILVLMLLGVLVLLAFSTYLMRDTVIRMQQSVHDISHMWTKERLEMQVRQIEHIRKLEEDCLILTEQILRDSGKQVTLYRRPPIEKTGQNQSMHRGWQSGAIATSPEQDQEKRKRKENS